MAPHIGVIINPTLPSVVVALLPGDEYRRVSSWQELLDLLNKYSAQLVIDPKDTELIVRILNGNP